MAGYASPTKTKDKSQDAHRQALRSPGRPLSPHLRAQMQSRFGSDFSHVQIHTGPEAAAAAQAVYAKAYTVGQDIVFSNGRFAPATSSGLQLLGHELAHVVQQQRGGTPPALDPGSANETAAATAGRQVAQSSGPVTVAGASSVGLARQEEDEPFWRRGLSGLQNFAQSARQQASETVETVRSIPDRVREAARDFDRTQAARLADITSPGPHALAGLADRVAGSASKIPLVGDTVERAATKTRDLSRRMIQANREVTAGVLLDAHPQQAIDQYIKEVDTVVKEGINFLEEEDYRDEAALAEEHRNVPVVGQVLAANAAVAKFQSEISGGFVKAAWDIVPGLASMANHPLESARGLTEIPGFEQSMPAGTGGLVKTGIQGIGYLYDVHVEGQDPNAAGQRFAESQRDDPARDMQKLGQLWDGITKGYQESIDEGRYGEIPGRLLFDIGSFFIPGGAATKGGKTAATAGRLGRGGSALMHGAEGVRGLSAGGHVTQVERALEATGSATRGVAGAERGLGRSSGAVRAGAREAGQGSRPFSVLEGGGQTTPRRTPKLDVIEGGRSPRTQPPTKPPKEPATQAKSAVPEKALPATGTEGPVVHTPSPTLHSPIQKPTAVTSQPPIRAAGGGSGGRKPPRQSGGGSGGRKGGGGGQGSGGGKRPSKQKNKAVERDIERRRQRQQREAERERPLDPRTPEQISARQKADRLYDRVRDGEFKNASVRTKQKLLQRFERLMRRGGALPQEISSLKGRMNELLRTPTRATQAGKAQPEFLAGGPRLPDQGRRGTVRPDFSDTRRTPQGGVRRVHVNDKADNIHEMTEAAAVQRARRYTDKAVVESRGAQVGKAAPRKSLRRGPRVGALPEGESSVIRYINEPNRSVQEAMVREHFRPDSPISEVHFGSTVFRRISMESSEFVRM